MVEIHKLEVTVDRTRLYAEKQSVLRAQSPKKKKRHRAQDNTGRYLVLVIHHLDPLLDPVLLPQVGVKVQRLPLVRSFAEFLVWTAQDLGVRLVTAEVIECSK